MKSRQVNMKQNKGLSEHTLWEEMRDNIGYKGHFSRVESPDTSPGIPDVDFCLFSKEGHIELKFIEEKPKKGWIRPTQVKWFRDRVKNGGHPWLFVLIIFKGQRVYCIYDGKILPELAYERDAQKIMSLSTWMWLDKMDWAHFMNIIAH